MVSDPTPMTAVDHDIGPGTTVELAAGVCLSDCLEHVRDSRTRTLSEDDAEGPHQVRVGLRRLRSALRLFRPAIGGPAADDLAERARSFGQTAAATRDLDVFATETLPRLGADLSGSSGDAIGRRLQETRTRERGRLRAALGGAEMDGFLRDLEEFILHRGWLRPEDYGQTPRLAQPVSDFARSRLSALWKKTSKRARALEGEDADARHEFRKDLKKLRYAVEFLAPALPAKRVKPFVKRLKTLQDRVGALNDVETARHLAEEERLAGVLDAESVAALEVGVKRLAEKARPEARAASKAWAELAGTRLLWKG